MQFPLRPVLGAALLAMAAAAPLSAQIVTGRLTDASTQAPLAGAFVQLLDSAGARQAGALTDSAGRYRLRPARPGAYRVRAEQLGFQAVTSPLLPLTTGTLEHDVRLSPRALVLPALTARAEERRCERRPDGPAVYELWIAVRAALEVAAWTREARLMRFGVVNYTRELDPALRSVRREERKPGFASAALPFRAVDAHYLAREGYLLRDGGNLLLLGLDADVMLSDPFLDSHCFRLVTARDTGIVGLGFEPLRRDGRVDVKGVLWVDRSNAVLRRLEYEFVDLPDHLANFTATGAVHFRRLDNGIWMIERWWIRTPLVTQRGRLFELTGHREDGGMITSAERVDVPLQRVHGPGVIQGLVFDSIRSAPLPAARVFLTGSPFSATTDSAGRYRIANVPAGRYEIGFTHPLLQELRAATALDSVAVVAGRVATRSLAGPSIRTVLRTACPREQEETTTGLLHGVVMQDDGPVANVEVRVSWIGPPGSGVGPDAQRWRTTMTAADGSYVLCWLPTDRALELRADAAGLRSRTRRVQLEGAAILRIDIS